MKDGVRRRWWLTGQNPTEALFGALAGGLAEAAAWTVAAATLLGDYVGAGGAWAFPLVLVWIWLTTAGRLARWTRSLFHHLVRAELEVHEYGGGCIRSRAPWGTGAWLTFDRKGKTAGGRLQLQQTADGLRVRVPGGPAMSLSGAQASTLRDAGVHGIAVEEDRAWTGPLRPLWRWGILLLMGLVPVHDPLAGWPLVPLALVGGVLPVLGWFDARAGRVNLSKNPPAADPALHHSEAELKVRLPLLGQQYATRRVPAPFRLLGWGLAASIAYKWLPGLIADVTGGIPHTPGTVQVELAPFIEAGKQDPGFSDQVGLLVGIAITLALASMGPDRSPFRLTATPTGITVRQGSASVHIPTSEVDLDVVDLPRGALLVLSSDLSLTVDVSAAQLHLLLASLRPMYRSAGTAQDGQRMRQALQGLT